MDMKIASSLYYPISQFYRKRFNAKVYKIPVSVAETCPNREGLRGMKTCNFCDVWGSAAYPEIREEPLAQQIETTRQTMIDFYKAEKFLVYFQAYTNTFTRVAKLRDQFQTAFQFSDVIGAVVGTRPDCLSPAVFDLWNEWAQSKFIAVELGVQSFNNASLEWMRRGHSAEKSLAAIQKIRKACPDVNLGIHLIFGSPGETREDIIHAARITSELRVDNVKLHNLHVLKSTPLEEDYLQGRFAPLSLDEYAGRVQLFLEHLDPKIAVHRLAALARRSAELVAPQWTSKKMEIYQTILSRMQANGSYQGKMFMSEDSTLSSRAIPLN